MVQHEKLLVAVMVLFLAAGSVAAEEEVGIDACFACHGAEGFSGPDGQPLYTSAETFNASAHASLQCTACHSDSVPLPHAESLQQPDRTTCAGCHADAVEAYQRGIHADGQAAAQRTPSCTDCHGGTHSALPHTNRKSAAHWSNLAATCARCHASLELPRESTLPVVRPVSSYLSSVHGRAVAARENSAVCSDCHRAHDILPAADPRSSIARTNVSATCGACHTPVFVAYRDSVHGQAMVQGVREAPVCTDCHGEHRILPHTETASPISAANVSATCSGCHADERLSQKYGLPLGKVAAFEDSYHGLALRSGRVTVANCSSCHGVHNIFPSNDPRSSVNKINLPQTCGECHPGAGKRFAVGPVHGAENAFGTLAVSWVRIIYLCMILGTIGLMAAHNLLDFAHKVRYPEPPAVAVPAGQPERMPRLVRWQHGLVMLSFPILVYTGFALNFPESWWAAPLLQWEAHIGFRGLLHRITAVILMAAVLWHGLHVVVSRRMRACMKGMWVSFKDLKDALAMLTYYFGRRPTRPHMRKFSYTEKAEYWAFLWGTAVMSVTGFMLWFINVTLRYLPSWAADVATAIHFYEAILATLSILVWHFYWVIFDPDVYPVDRTFWNGHPPASRVLERSEGAEESELTRVAG